MPNLSCVKHAFMRGGVKDLDVQQFASWRLSRVMSVARDLSKHARLLACWVRPQLGRVTCGRHEGLSDPSGPFARSITS